LEELQNNFFVLGYVTHLNCDPNEVWSRVDGEVLSYVVITCQRRYSMMDGVIICLC